MVIGTFIMHINNAIYRMTRVCAYNYLLYL